MTRGRISRKKVQETLAYLQGNPRLLENLTRFERLKRWTVDLFQMLHPTEDRTTTYRHLERLIKLGCLGKHGAAGKGGGGSAAAVYYLSALGARVLTHALEREQPVTYVRPTSRVQETHDLAITELAAGWRLLPPAWRVQSPVSYIRNRPLLDQAREYLEALPPWREWQEKAPLREAAQREATELRGKRDSLARQIEDIEARWKECTDWRTSANLRKEIVELRVQKEKLEWFDLRDAESKLNRLAPPPHLRPQEPIVPWALQSAYKDKARPGQSLEEWAADLQPEPAYFIPDLYARFPRQDRPDWVVCIEVEARTERRHIEEKYHRYAEAKDALDGHLLSIYIVFTSQKVAQQALPQHRRVLNTICQGAGPWLIKVSFTDLDRLREIEGEGTPERLIWEGMQWEWETETTGIGGNLRGALHKAYEEKWEKWERQKREQERKAYWAFRKNG